MIDDTFIEKSRAESDAQIRELARLAESARNEVTNNARLAAVQTEQDMVARFIKSSGDSLKGMV